MLTWGKFAGVDPYDLTVDELHEVLAIYKNDHTARAAIRSEMYRRGLFPRYRRSW
jgi:hypothetical protein